MKKAKTRRICLRILVGLMTVAMLFSLSATAAYSVQEADYIKKLENVVTNKENYFDSSVVHALPDSIKDTDEISVIVTFSSEALMDAYERTDKESAFKDYATSEEAYILKDNIAVDREILLSRLDREGVVYEVGSTYTNIVSGVELIIEASYYDELCDTLSAEESVYISEVYNVAETQLVENKVDVYETGIFDSSEFAYDGSGMLIAVLDTGLDYTHSAFSPERFEGSLVLTKDKLEGLISKTAAAKLVSGLTADDCYINDKVPFGFDYADNDSDVYSLHNNHGTHVSGVIVGNDDTIRGVAPNAQLVSMKIFSDVMESSRTAWILAALEDCVTLGVDVINMSLGTACGFSTETDKEFENGVYEKIRDAGISLVVAASNSFTSSYGSEKNGNLGLTSNPDTSTVGSPSTYEGAMSVASINGAKTPYILYTADGEDTIIYFNEATDSASEEKSFFDEIMTGSESSLELEYVVIPGVGRAADYTGIDVTGKIVLVRRGSTTFEEKARAAKQKGARGIIVYNNTSGDIKMNAGIVDIPICSISQNDGELLAAQGSGTIRIAKDQSSGPFMSDFSSMGPSPSLEIKPEITAHGGNILSAVTGGDYDRLSGTSMACPNMAGVIALMRQYVIENFSSAIRTSSGGIDYCEVNAIVNRLLMSTADIVYNKNGLPYAVRKQGAGLASLTEAAATQAYILTYDREDGTAMDKTKIELGDDPERSGVYVLKFAINNFGQSALTYNVGAIVMTEGVSETPTHQGETTVTEEGYLLTGATVQITGCTSSGTLDGTTVTVGGGKVCEIELTITLSDADKKYLDDSFENGMYVEGFVTLDSTLGDAYDLCAPYLAFYGNWYEAPIFDLDYFETNKDELDDSIELLDKTLPDAYATRPIGGVDSDYVSYLGSYYFVQNPEDRVISASRDYIAISNTEGTVHSLRFVWGGLLRNAKKIDISITDDATGEVVYTVTQTDIRKSYGDGGSYIYPANIEIEFDAAEHNLKNNTTYSVKLVAYLDYGDGGVDENKKNTFEFPLTTDFSSPTVTDCEFYTEYDKSEKKTRLFARLAIYDNHYTMAMQVGYVGNGTDPTTGEETAMLYPFSSYLTPIYSNKNSTTYVTYELTDYIYDIKNNSYNPNSFTVSLYDYALNEATYEIPLPDDFCDFYFEQTDITLSPNETYSLTPLLYPDTEWGELLSYTSSNEKVVRIVNNKLFAVGTGEANVYAYDPNEGIEKEIRLHVTVLGEDDDGYRKISRPVADEFYLTGYETLKAYYIMANSERDIGETGDSMVFTSSSYSLSFYPSESVKLKYKLDAFFPGDDDRDGVADTKIVFSSGNEEVVTVDQNGVITAVDEGYTTVTVSVYLFGKSTYYAETVSVEVKDPYVRSGPTLTNYYGIGLGGIVDIDEDLLFTEIGQFAFSNYDYVPKNTEMGDLIEEDENDTTKMWYIGDDEITKVIIPEGVKKIGPYAFAGLTSLVEVVLPSTLEAIEYGAFYGCSSLKTVRGLENVKLINMNAFAGTSLTGELVLTNARAVSNYAFANTDVWYYDRTNEAWGTRESGSPTFTSVTFSDLIGSVSEYAFAGNTKLERVSAPEGKVKYGPYVFMGCTSLSEIRINTSVIPEGAFLGATSLERVTLGKDVTAVGAYAFMNTPLTSFTVEEGNTAFTPSSDKSYLLSADGTTLVLVAPGVSGEFVLDDARVSTIGTGAFSGNRRISSVKMPSVVSVGDYAFSDATSLKEISLGNLSSIGKYAFYNTPISTLPAFDAELSHIGAYAFAFTDITSVNIQNNLTTSENGVKTPLVIGEGAFAECRALRSVVIGDDIEIGLGAFMLSINSTHPRTGKTNYTTDSYVIDGTTYYGWRYLSALTSLKIGDRVKVGNSAFYGASEILVITLGKDVTLGDQAFYNTASLASINLDGVTAIGEMAFSGDILYLYSDNNMYNVAVKDNAYVYKYYTPVFTSVNLGATTELGRQAFQYCKSLKAVTLGDGLTEIPYMAFANCDSLRSVNLDAVKTLGYAAFSETDLVQMDLSSVEEIGEYAFAYCDKLQRVTLNPNGALVLEGAFAYDSALSTVENLGAVTEIGAYAFAYTDLTEIDLSAATSVGDLAFLKELRADGTRTPVTLTLGDALCYIGDNPFAMCELLPVSTTRDVYFGDTVQGTEILYTFEINEFVKIVDGSIYCKVPYGYELITYTGMNSENLVLPEDTVRITAMAFAASDVVRVTLPEAMNAIGHKAFYACDDLSLVIFKSYYAPILEEEFDPTYHDSYQNIPCTGEFEFSLSADEDGDGVADTVFYEGLGIVPYYMWNAASGNYSLVYYGASFVDYIGHTENYDNMGKLMMVRPSNGQYYDTFIYNQYFSMAIDGALAADDTTLAAIEAIGKLPDQVKLSDEALVIAAREAYDKISSLEQQSLVVDLYNKLREAEIRIQKLKSTNEEPTEDDPTPTPTPSEGVDAGRIVLIVLVCVESAAIAAYVVYLLYKKYLKNRKSPCEGTDAPTEECADAPTEECADAPAEECADAPAEECANAPTEESADAPAEESANAPAEECANAPAEESANAPAEECANAPTEESADAPTKESADVQENGTEVEENE